MRRAAIAVLALAGVTAAAPLSHRASGTFEVALTPEAEVAAPAGGVATRRMGIVKRFTGGMQGEAHGTMLSAGTPAPGQAAAYVAIDQFHGRVDGREGGFVLLHRGVMTRRGASDLSVTIADDSGTGALSGIAGTLTIDTSGGGHRYTLDYTLPDGR